MQNSPAERTRILPGMAIVRLRGQLEKLAGGGSEHEIDGAHRQRAAAGRWRRSTARSRAGSSTSAASLRRHINVFVNGEPAEPDSPVTDGDKIEILPAISGG